MYHAGLGDAPQGTGMPWKDDPPHERLCRVGIAKMMLRLGDVTRGVQMAFEGQDRDCCRDCAAILEAQKNLGDAARLYEMGEQLDKAATPFAAEFARFPADAFVVMRRNLAAANGAIVVGTMPESHGVGRGVLLEVGRKIDSSMSRTCQRSDGLGAPVRLDNSQRRIAPHADLRCRFTGCDGAQRVRTVLSLSPLRGNRRLTFIATRALLENNVVREHAECVTFNATWPGVVERGSVCDDGK
jgi:hypothetical protein